MTGKTLTLTKAALYLGYSRRTLYNMLKDNRFSVAPINGTNPRRWNIEDLDAWRNAGQPSAQAELALQPLPAGDSA